MSAHPSPLPGNDTNTSNLSFIPTLTEDKRADNRKIKDKKEDGKKSGWGWLLGKEDGEKDKKSEGGSSKPKAKITKAPEKHDNTRLDVLQSSIDGGSGKGRESLVLDRDGLKLEEERKKESQRKSAGSDSKKEKEGLFSSLFGGGKKGKAEKESTARKHLSRGLSPEPPYRELKPDIDYNWTRFSILEERAIYRMAHIKLANPRRALYSQVLLSNFMYSYLAKVQQMHPQMNLPTSAKAQKKQQQQPKQQPDEFTQYQKYQQVKLNLLSLQRTITNMTHSNSSNSNPPSSRSSNQSLRNSSTLHNKTTKVTPRCTTTTILTRDQVPEAASSTWRMAIITVRLRVAMGILFSTAALLVINVMRASKMICGDPRCFSRRSERAITILLMSLADCFDASTLFVHLA